MNVLWITFGHRDRHVLMPEQIDGDGAILDSDVHIPYGEWLWLNLLDLRQANVVLLPVGQIQDRTPQAQEDVSNADLIVFEVMEHRWTAERDHLYEYAQPSAAVLCASGLPLTDFMQQDAWWGSGRFDGMIWGGMPGEERVLEPLVRMPVFACPPVVTEAYIQNARRPGMECETNLPPDFADALFFARAGQVYGARAALHTLRVASACTDRPIYCLGHSSDGANELTDRVDAGRVNILPYMTHGEWVKHCEGCFCLLDMIAVETFSRSTVAGYGGAVPSIGSHHLFMTLLFPDLLLAYGHQGAHCFAQRLDLVTEHRELLLARAAGRLSTMTPEILRPRFVDFLTSHDIRPEAVISFTAGG